jgi:preprotein translocase subunit SecD
VIDLEVELRGALADTADLVTTSTDPWSSYRTRSASRTPRHGRTRLVVSLASVVAVTAGIVIGAIALTSGGNASHHRLQALNGQPVTLRPQTPISAADLTASATILTERLTALGGENVHIRAVGGSLRAQVPSSAIPELTSAAATRGVLRFRQAMSVNIGAPTAGLGSTTQQIPPRQAESPTVTAAFLKTYRDWNCSRDPNPTGGQDIPADYIIACAPATGLKYLLAPAAIEGTQITTSSASRAFSTGTRWVIDVTFDASGSTQWFNVTKTAYQATNGQVSGPGSCTPPTGCNAIAITLDGIVQSAPTIEADGIAGGQAAIFDNLTHEGAEQLVNTIKYGPLPTTFTVENRTNTR